VGLDAHVRCNCVRDGLTPPPPFPALLAYDENNEPYLKEEGTVEHDRWLEESCPHHGTLIDKHIGNIALVAFLRDEVEKIGKSTFPIVLGRVLYSGTHCEDAIPAGDVAALSRELKSLEGHQLTRELGEFVADTKELCEASLATGNPIVF
jgi:class 3 adenylate cyclase